MQTSQCPRIMGTLPRRPPEAIPSGPSLRAGVKSMPYSVMGQQRDVMPMGAGPSPSRALQTGNRGCFMLSNCEVTIEHSTASSLRASGATTLPKSPNKSQSTTLPLQASPCAGQSWSVSSGGGPSIQGPASA